MDQLAEFGRLTGHLHRGGEWYYTWTDTSKESLWTRVGQRLRLPRGHVNVYFSVHPAARRKSQHQRATIADVCAVNTLFAEFDAKDFGGEKVAALAHIETLARAPSVIVNSGGGYHCYWLLDRTFFLTDDASRARARRLQATWVAFVGGDPGAKDLARILRVPGTFNYKYDPPRPIEFVRADFDRVYGWDELAGVATRDETQTQPEPLPDENGTHPSPYASAALQNELGILMTAPVGHRNDQLYRSSLALGQLVGAGVLDRTMVEERLHAAALAIGLSENEVRATIRSGLEAGIKQPRAVPRRNNHGTTWHQETVAEDGEHDWLPVADVMRCLERGEIGDAELFTKLFAGRAVFDHSDGNWSIWNGYHWERDVRRCVINWIANEVAAHYLHAAATLRRDDNPESQRAAKELSAHANSLRYRNKISNVLALAQSQKGVALQGSE